MRALLLFCCLCALAASVGAAEWVGLAVPGAHIYVHPGQEQLARRVGAAIAEDLPRINATVGVASPGPFPLYIYTDRMEFLQAAGTRSDLVGLSYSPGGKMLVDASGELASVRRTLAHELTHSLLDQRLGDNFGELPTWVNEGLAGHLSDPVTPMQMAQVSRLIYQGQVLPLERLETAFDEAGDQSAAYLQTRSMIAWLEYHHPGALRRLIDGLAAGKSFSRALHDAAGLTADQWWEQWHASVPAYIYWVSLLNTPLVYAPLSIIFLLVIILRYRRKEPDEPSTDDDANGEDDPAPLLPPARHPGDVA